MPNSGEFCLFGSVFGIKTVEVWDGTRIGIKIIPNSTTKRKESRSHPFFIINPPTVSSVLLLSNPNNKLRHFNMLVPFLTRGDVLVQVTLLMASVANGFSSSPSNPNNNQCAVVGVGVLGTSLCRQILKTTTDWTVTGITKTTNRHDDIRQAMPADQVHRLTLTTTTTAADTTTTTTPTQFRNVVFCAPPSGSEDYAADVQEAVQNLWMGPDAGGVFCFTSSGGM